MTTYVIENRRLIEVNTDPQRRCYHGVHAKSEMRWTAWTKLETWSKGREQAERRLEFWRGLGRIALEGRGEVIDYRLTESEE